MHQEVLRRNVLRVLRIWRSRFIFSDDFLNGLQVYTPFFDQIQRSVKEGLLNYLDQPSVTNYYRPCSCMLKGDTFAIRGNVFGFGVDLSFLLPDTILSQRATVNMSISAKYQLYQDALPQNS